MNEMCVIVNNMVNVNIIGFCWEGVIFFEYMVFLGNYGDMLVMVNICGCMVDLELGGIIQINGIYDLVIEGDGFFMVQILQGNCLICVGVFMINVEGELINLDGYQVLDDGQVLIVVFFGSGSIGIGFDGMVLVDGQLLGCVGVFVNFDLLDLCYVVGMFFEVGDGIEFLEDVCVCQGFVEEFNVNFVIEIVCMIEVQCVYELGQFFLDQEDQCIWQVIILFM